jgi:hypothetical protein
MVRLDLKNMKSRDVNRKLKELLKTEDQIEIDNPHSIHNFATALIGQGKITIHLVRARLPSTGAPDFTRVDSWKDRPSLLKEIPAGIPATICWPAKLSLR